MSDQIAVMNHDEIVQKGTPEQIYADPADLFIAQFLGSTNLFEGVVSEIRQNGFLTIELPDGTEVSCRGKSSSVGSRATISVRPEAISVPDRRGSGSGQDNVILGNVTNETYSGATVRYEVAAKDRNMIVINPASKRIPVGDEVEVRFAPENAIAFA